MHKIDLIAGARPNFMKIAPLYHALCKESWCRLRLVHTGQHFDADMSDSFFHDLGLPAPDCHMGVGGGSHAQQTARVMVGYEEICLKDRPELTIVVGDVDSTLACTLVAKKMGIPVAHLESGLRSRDRAMPEEINRIVTDSISDYLWTPSPDGDENLKLEGVPAARILRVGNIMLDSYEMLRQKIDAEKVVSELGLKPRGYAVVTLHRPSNVDQPASLAALVARLIEVASRVPIVFPVHPRTSKNLKAFGLYEKFEKAPGVRLVAPQSYKGFMKLVHDSKLVITDSGGVQEETTYLDIPCLTLRENTERPITVTQGTNTLVNEGNLLATVAEVLAGTYRKARVCPDLWDGQTASRIVAHLRRIFGQSAS